MAFGVYWLGAVYLPVAFVGGSEETTLIACMILIGLLMSRDLELVIRGLHGILVKTLWTSSVCHITNDFMTWIPNGAWGGEEHRVPANYCGRFKGR